MSKGVLRRLWRELAFTPSEIFRADFFLGIAGAGGAAAMAVMAPVALLRGVSVAAGLVGVIIGSVIAGLAVQAAFMDQSFLRKLAAINRANHEELAAIERERLALIDRAKRAAIEHPKLAAIEREELAAIERAKRGTIEYKPVRYIASFVFTAAISVFAMLGLIVLSTLSDKANVVLLGTVGGLTGFFIIWAIASLIYDLDALVQFTNLKMDAADTPDDAELIA